MTYVRTKPEIQDFFIESVSKFLFNQSTILSIDTDDPILREMLRAQEHLGWDRLLQRLIIKDITDL